MKRLCYFKNPMDDSLANGGDNSKKVLKEFVSFAGIVTLINLVVSFAESMIPVPSWSEDFVRAFNLLISILGTFLVSLIVKGLIVLVSNIRRNRWIKNKKKVWVKGVWFHTHVKENGAIRVGYVIIQQYFDLVKAEGHNVSLGEDPNKKNWEYLTGRVFPNAQDDNDIVCVFANRKHSRIENTGTHVFEVEEGTDGFPVELKGEFKDTVSNELKSPLKEAIGNEKKLYEKLGEHYGTVFLFRPSNEILESLTKKGKKAPSLDLIREYALDIKKAYKENPSLDPKEYDAFGEGIINALKKSAEKKGLLK